jgi:hypothetical protein
MSLGAANDREINEIEEEHVNRDFPDPRQLTCATDLPISSTS